MAIKMERVGNIEKEKNNRLVVCAFCIKPITNNTIKPLILVCEEDNFFHFECYEKSGEEVDIDKVVRAFDKARIKY